jgi:hypothetical protein
MSNLKIDELIKELRNCRTNLVCLIDKAWEMGGYLMDEDEFESDNDIKDAREQIEVINDIERIFNNQ